MRVAHTVTVTALLISTAQLHLGVPPSPLHALLEWGASPTLGSWRSQLQGAAVGSVAREVTARGTQAKVGQAPTGVLEFLKVVICHWGSQSTFHHIALVMRWLCWLLTDA